MEKFKARAWDRKNKKMIYPSKFDETIVIQLGGVIGRFNGNSYDTATDEIVIQLYTGLKDRNGKEIYEGDILKIEGFKNPMNVYFKDGYFGWGKEHYGYYSFDPFSIEKIEIIGNIYENPELLKN